jgi:hypothetical protein
VRFEDSPVVALRRRRLLAEECELPFAALVKSARRPLSAAKTLMSVCSVPESMTFIASILAIECDLTMWLNSARRAPR